MAATALFLLLAATASPAPSVCDRSVAYILQGRYDAALQQLEGAKTSGASPAGVENLRGLTFLLEGDLTKALASFDRALQLDRTMSEARLNRGIARLRAGRLLDASDDLQTVTNDEHSALRGDAAYHNAIVLDRLGRLDDAETGL
jgi:tetratricopeptide (TPR) repeat protein